MDSTLTDLIALKSPFNGSVIYFSHDQCNPAMLAAMIRAGFVQMNQKTKAKEKPHGEIER